MYAYQHRIQQYIHFFIALSISIHRRPGIYAHWKEWPTQKRNNNSETISIYIWNVVDVEYYLHVHDICYTKMRSDALINSNSFETEHSNILGILFYIFCFPMYGKPANSSNNGVITSNRVLRYSSTIFRYLKFIYLHLQRATINMHRYRLDSYPCGQFNHFFLEMKCTKYLFFF